MDADFFSYVIVKNFCAPGSAVSSLLVETSANTLR